ncbi:MAG TPA: GDSL-type esterase/lipase family protein [Opitutaceae bacterium]
MLLWLLAPGGVALAARVLPTESPRWSAKLARIVAADQAKPPPTGGVVFAGSSSIERWPALADTFPGATVLNRGVGGSWLSDFADHVDQLVLACEPRTVVLYAGENDIAAGFAPADVLAAFNEFRARLRAAAPRARLIFLALKPCPRRAKLIPAMQEANALIAAECRKDPDCTFIDTFSPLLDAEGKPSPELYAADGVHLSKAGYRVWNDLLLPVLKPVATRNDSVTPSALKPTVPRPLPVKTTRAEARES